MAPEISIYDGPWRWGAWIVAAVGLLSVPLLLASDRAAPAVGIGVISGTIMLEAIGVGIAATRPRLARVLHVVALSAICGLLALFMWRNPFDSDGSRWLTFAIIVGLSLLRSFREAWREAAPAGRDPFTVA